MSNLMYLIFVCQDNTVLEALNRFKLVAIEGVEILCRFFF